jgi:hypothetical protein
MKFRNWMVCGMVIATAAVAVGCSSTASSVATGGSPDKQLVERAAGLAFHTHATCSGPRGPIGYPEYTCQDHPRICGVSNNDGGTGCWRTTCDVRLGVTTRSGDTEDFYYCERAVRCPSFEGGCSDEAACVVGQGTSLAVDKTRTAALPANGTGVEFSCPYHDEG